MLLIATATKKPYICIVKIQVMNIDDLSREERTLLKSYRRLTPTVRRRFRKEIEKIIEEAEEAEDIRDVKKRRKEPAISEEELREELGI